MSYVDRHVSLDSEGSEEGSVWLVGIRRTVNEEVEARKNELAKEQNTYKK
jgi:hypothetical protein